MIIRPCTLDDVEAIISLGTKMQQEASDIFPEVQPDVVRASAEKFFGAPGFCALIAIEEYEAIGFVTGFLASRSFNEELFVVNDMFFVDPSHRSLRAFLGLLKAFDDWAIENGATSSMFAVSTGRDLSKLMGRVGYQKVGENYVRRF